MAGPLALAGLSRAGKAVTNDLVVVEGRWFRKVRSRVTVTDDQGRPLRTKKGRVRKTTLEVLEPVDVEAHVNPVGIGLGVLALGVAAVGAAIVWNGITVAAPLIGPVKMLPGLKESPRGQRLAELFDRRFPILSGDPSTLPPRTDDTVIIDGETRPPGDYTKVEWCAELQRRYGEARAARNYTDARRWILKAREEGCPWAAA